MQGSFKRIQFTPDLVPADLVGTRIYNQKTGEFATVLGPVFANLVLADEINRAPAKVQSALLEVMQERQVTIAGESHRVPAPFVVMATQNPIETEGTYALPEAQVDRFMMKVLVGYPSRGRGIRHRPARHRRRRSRSAPSPPPTTLLAMQQESRKVYVDPSLVTYAVKLVAATRDPRKAGLRDHQSAIILYGASPRATIGLIEAGRALAYPARPRLCAARRCGGYRAPMCCATAWCRPTRRWPKASPPTSWCADIMRAVPAPEKVLDARVAASA